MANERVAAAACLLTEHGGAAAEISAADRAGSQLLHTAAAAVNGHYLVVTAGSCCGGGGRRPRPRGFAATQASPLHSAAARGHRPGRAACLHGAFRSQRRIGPAEFAAP